MTRSSWLLDDRTRTLRTEIDLPNPDGILRPGMYATARIPVSRPESLTLPTSSVFLQDDQAWVVRLVANKAVRTPVRLGLRDRQRVEVLRKQTHPVDQGSTRRVGGLHRHRSGGPGQPVHAGRRAGDRNPTREAVGRVPDPRSLREEQVPDSRRDRRPV